MKIDNQYAAKYSGDDRPNQSGTVIIYRRPDRYKGQKGGDSCEDTSEFVFERSGFVAAFELGFFVALLVTVFCEADIGF
jgi:hypothetical protein